MKISEILIKEYKKQKLNRIVDLLEFRSTKEQINAIELDLKERTKNYDIDPNHKIYSLIQNLLSYFSEEISVRNEFNDYYEEAIEIDEVYMPSYPPNSPITGSYDTLCMFCDYRIGKEKETIGSIFYDILAEEMKAESPMLKGLHILNNSSMGLYKHMGIDNDLVKLKDVINDKEYLCLSTSKYIGKKDEIWFVRLVPNLDEVYNYQVVLTTPYVILNYKDQDWIRFLERQGINKNTKEAEVKYLNFMKNNPKNRYWYDYIMDSYLNYESNCIFLTGIPDVKGSKPHELGM